MTVHACVRVCVCVWQGGMKKELNDCDTNNNRLLNSKNGCASDVGIQDHLQLNNASTLTHLLPILIVRTHFGAALTLCTHMP